MAPPPQAAPPAVKQGVTAAAILAAKQNMDSQRQNNKPKRTPSERIQVTDTFKAELQRRVGNEANSREFVLPTKVQRKLPDASISKKSSSREVKKWLMVIKNLLYSCDSIKFTSHEPKSRKHFFSKFESFRETVYLTCQK